MTFSAAGDITALSLSKLNQNVGLALFHLWPGLLALMALSNARRALAMIVLFLAIATTVALSDHASSQVALIGSAVVMLLAWRWRRHVVRSLAVLWCAAFVLVIPASLRRLSEGLASCRLVAEFRQTRIIIWEFTAEQTLTHPFLGSGVEFDACADQAEGGHANPRAARGLHLPPHLGPPRPQYVPANLERTRCDRGTAIRCRRRGRHHARSPLARPGSALRCRGLRRLYLGERFRLGHVAILVHVCRGIAPALSSRGKRHDSKSKGKLLRTAELTVRLVLSPWRPWSLPEQPGEIAGAILHQALAVSGVLGVGRLSATFSIKSAYCAAIRANANRSTEKSPCDFEVLALVPRRQQVVNGLSQLVYVVWPD